MKQLLIAGNWKSNKTTGEADEWLRIFSRVAGSSLAGQIAVVLCVPFTLLPFFKSKNPAFMLGAQDVSPFGDGAYTGEVNARQIKEFADWVIIGHSERRKNFGETDEILAKKVEQAKGAGLKIMYCVPDDTTVVPGGVDVVAYEPVWAIGTGKSDTPENASSVITNIKATSQVATVLYGGSVTAENIFSFVNQENIDGVLPGGASLDPEKFSALIQNAR
jgi:triosephosphate isomerase